MHVYISEPLEIVTTCILKTGLPVPLMEMIGRDRFPLRAALVNVSIIWVSFGNMPSAVTVMSILLIIDPLLVEMKTMSD